MENLEMEHMEIVAVPGDNTWMRYGKCVDMSPSVFFPSDGAGVEVARQICRDCPCKEACLEYALANRIDHGVWGGTSERQRRRILRARRIGRMAPMPSST